MEQKIGGFIALAVCAIIGVVVYLNLQPVTPPSSTPTLESQSVELPAGFREYPIGETKRNQMLIAAVWLPPIQMAGLELPQDDDVIHLEADIHALEGNLNGFGRGAWIPYLTVKCDIIPADSDKEPIHDTLLPMVAKDGPHYGATIRMPGPGKYRLVYHLDPPSYNGFGRHSDPVTGVAEWWEPFAVEFEFNYPGSNPARASSPPVQQ